MSYNLTEGQQALLRWFVERVRSGDLPEEFHIAWLRQGTILDYAGPVPEITKSMLDALCTEHLLRCDIRRKTSIRRSGSKNRPKFTQRETETAWTCALTQQGYEAVASDFQLPEQVQPPTVTVHFDQRHQQVNYQYNAGGDINFGAVQNTVHLVGELEKLKAEVRMAGDANVIDGEIVDDAEYQLTKAISQAKKAEPDKKTLLDHLNKAKAFLETATAAASLVGGVTAAIEAVQKVIITSQP